MLLKSQATAAMADIKGKLAQMKNMLFLQEQKKEQERKEKIRLQKIEVRDMQLARIRVLFIDLPNGPSKYIEYKEGKMCLELIELTNIQVCDGVQLFDILDAEFIREFEELTNGKLMITQNSRGFLNFRLIV